MHTHSPEEHDYLPAAGHDRWLPCYDLYTRLMGVRAVHRELIDRADLRDGQRVLEIGCGTGNLTVLAKRMHPGVDFTGSDPDPLALDRARRKARGAATFDRGYAQELPYPDGSFDVVLSALMLHHLPTDVRTLAVSELRRVLRPGGRVLVADFGGPMTAADGFMARRMLASGRMADNLGTAIPDLFDSAGFRCTQLATVARPHWARITFYRAERG
jgi:ubiquinone/menaquinone biosynthesis C-methylase UbiE